MAQSETITKGKRQRLKLPQAEEEMDAWIKAVRLIIKSSLSEEDQRVFDQEFWPERSLKESLTGTTNLLLVAPHGFPGDDDYTDYLTYFLSKDLDTSYLINNKKFRKPENRRTFGIPANLNRPKRKNKHIQMFMDTMIMAISKLRETLKADPLVILIHGMKDQNANKYGVDFCIGAGDLYPQRDKAFVDGRATAAKEVVDGLMDGLKNARSNGYRVRDDITDYSGKETIPGYLKEMEDTIGPVNVVQLEMRYKGLREPENIINTSKMLGKLIRANPGSKIQVVLQSDIPLVNKAYNTLAEIFSRHYQNAMLEAGKYIIEEFYGGNIERARNKDPVEKESLNQLIQRLHNRSTSAPSKSWIYNAVNLVVETEDLKGFHTYGNLLLSHKMLLLPIDNLEFKKKLVQETVDNNYTIEQLRNRIGEVWGKETKAKEQKSLPQLIKKPELLLSDEFSSAIEEKSLSKLKLPTLNKFTVQAQQKIDEIEKSIEELHSQVTRYKELIHIVEKVRIKKSKKTPEKPKRSRFQDWVYKTVSCCNGCSNDCIYCFSKGDRVFQKKTLALEDWKKGEVRLHDVKKKYRYMGDPMMFPGTHDITPDNFEVCLKILNDLLNAGNRVFIVSKPRLQLIKTICEDLAAYQKNIIFRFTIGAKSDDVLSFWEPGAPPYRERKESLKYAYDEGYRTSVSIEPMLDAEHIEELVNDLSPFVNHSIWIGTMNHLWYFNADEKGAKTEKAKLRAKKIIDYLGEEKARQLIEESHKIEKGQSKESLREVYEQLKDKKLQGKDEPLVKWKWHIRKALGLPLPDKSEEWPID
jgi:DNA repair photolyase